MFNNESKQVDQKNLDDVLSFNEDEFQDAIDYEQQDDDKNNGASTKNLKLK